LAIAEKPWAPAPDEALLWFRPGSIFPARPRPLDFTLELYALTGGLTRALVSLNYPLYQIRPRLISGELYIASVPSGIAERDPETKMGLLRDASLRFTRNIRGPWERQIRREVEGYSAWMAEPLPESPPDIAERFRRLRRVREMQWFVIDRAVVGSFALLQRGLSDLAPDSPDRPKIAAAVEDGAAVLRDALGLVRDQGLVHLDSFVQRTAERLAAMNVLDAAEDIRWLEWREVRQALTEPGGWKMRAAQRRAAAASPQTGPGPDEIAPPRAPGALHMHLVREVVALLAA
jgi:hypothetical protein